VAKSFNQVIGFAHGYKIILCSTKFKPATMKPLIHFLAVLLLIICSSFISCKKEHTNVVSSTVIDTTYDHLPPDYKLDTLFSYAATPPMLLFTNYYVSRHSFYLPILNHIDTKNLKVLARYGNHPFVELTYGTYQYARGGDYLVVSIQIKEVKPVTVSVRITT
jgi:hypothetical protein